MMQPAGATTPYPDIDARAVAARIRRFVLSRPDLLNLLSRQSQLLPARVFPDVDSSGEPFLDIYLEEHRSFFELVRPHLRPGLRVLDVGGGCGFFHILAATAGAAVVSIEPSDAGFSLFRAVALPVVEAFTGRTDRFLDVRVEHLDAADGSFDLVVSSNVLEHVADLSRVMGAMYRMTARGETAGPSLPQLSLPVTLERLRSEQHLAARHGRLTRLALRPAVQRLLTRVPPVLMSPMVFEIRKAS